MAPPFGSGAARMAGPDPRRTPRDFAAKKPPGLIRGDGIGVKSSMAEMRRASVIPVGPTLVSSVPISPYVRSAIRQALNGPFDPTCGANPPDLGDLSGPVSVKAPA